MATTAKNSAKNEANNIETIEFDVKVNDKTISISCVADIMDAPIEVAEAFEDGKPFKGFMSLVGDVTANQLRAAGITPRIFNDEVLPVYEEASGLGKN